LEGFFDICIEDDGGYDESIHIITYKRWETDTEFEKRKIRYDKTKEGVQKRKELKELEKIQKRHNQYLELRKEFEPERV